jgi:uncharacterized integral membrane protein (TIGR00697 family)
MPEATAPRRGYRYYDLIVASFVAVLLISNIASTKILALGPLSFDGGTLLFPIGYIFGDILTEVYGYARGRRVIHAGFVANLVMALFLALVGALPSAEGWNNQYAYTVILGLTPRIVSASLVAYLAGSFCNSWVLSRLKVRTRGRWLWLRTIASTLVGEGIDTLLFVSIAFVGILPNALLTAVFVSNYLFKVGLEVVMTPLTYRVVNGLKRAEGEDYYDVGTDYSPFSTRI